MNLFACANALFVTIAGAAKPAAAMPRTNSRLPISVFFMAAYLRTAAVARRTRSSLSSDCINPQNHLAVNLLQCN
jgi:hypothetical protein